MKKKLLSAGLLLALVWVGCETRRYAAVLEPPGTRWTAVPNASGLPGDDQRHWINEETESTIGMSRISGKAGFVPAFIYMLDFAKELRSTPWFGGADITPCGSTRQGGEIWRCREVESFYINEVKCRARCYVADKGNAKFLFMVIAPDATFNSRQEEALEALRAVRFVSR